MKFLMIVCTVLLAGIGITAILVAQYWKNRYVDEYNRRARYGQTGRH